MKPFSLPLPMTFTLISKTSSRTSLEMFSVFPPATIPPLFQQYGTIAVSERKVEIVNGHEGQDTFYRQSLYGLQDIDLICMVER